MKTASNDKRIFGLDVLRAAAILFVLQMHSLEFIRHHAEVHYYWMFILDGVDLFFVLSGFLIGSILIKTIAKDGLTGKGLTQFWIRRWFRTLPAYFLILLVLIAGYYSFFGHMPPRVLEFFVFTQNFSSPHPHFFPEAWSLSVEEWFYLLIPLALFVGLKFSKNKRRTILLLICIVIIVIGFFRVYKAWINNFIEEGLWDQEIRKQVLTRMDSIMFGFLGAWMKFYKSRSWLMNKNVLFYTGLIILFGSRFVAANELAYYKYFYISAQSIGTLLLLPKLDSIKTGNGNISKALTFTSIISYSLYLVNYTIVLKVIIPTLLNFFGLDYINNGWHATAAWLLFWIISFAAAYMLYRFFEKPMMDLRERFIKRDEAIKARALH